MKSGPPRPPRGASGAQADADIRQAATAATVRALAGRMDVQIEFGADPVIGPASARLPPPPATADGGPALAQFRGDADTAACWLRYHDPTIHARYAPAGGEARRAFDTLEQARCAALGARRWGGVAANLRVGFAALCRSLGDKPVLEWSLAEVIPLLTYAALLGAALPEPLQFSLRNADQHLDRQRLARLAAALDQQETYAGEAAALLATLALDAEAEPEKRAMALAADDAEAETKHKPSEQRWIEREVAPPAYPDFGAGAVGLGYRAFTTEFDEIVGAESLASADELARLRRALDEQLKPLQGLVSRLANRLQRRLLAEQSRGWEYDLDEGLLDTRRLPQVILQPLTPLAFKREKNAKFRHTVVTLLIDNSRSMRGWPISAAAMSADILARTLERCAVRVEILGFTTRAWKLGQSGERWQAAGSPANPGRLNDLRHIVYKAADAPWRRARNNLGLMLRIDTLKQNVDGEALLWAHRRLLERPEQRRILIVISDGAPVDELTLQANAPDYLDRHLRQVIHAIETRSPIQLAAIGIGHDVTRYYRRAVKIKTAEEFGSVLVRQIEELFAAP
ncbi:MAG: cobaltochelatase subunit CobT [Gammaproteobacteria bacterium]